MRALLALRLAARGGSAAANLLLGRLLAPAAFGELAFWMALLALPDLAGTLGLFDALAGWQEGPRPKGRETAPGPPEKTASPCEDLERVVFRVSLFTSLVLFGGLFVLAPVLAQIFGRPGEAIFLRLLCLSLLATPWTKSTAVHVQLALRAGAGAETAGRAEGEGEHCEVTKAGSAGGRRDTRPESWRGETFPDPDALYRRYLWSALPGALLAPGAALLAAVLYRPAGREGLAVLLLLTLLRNFLDAISGPLFTGWRPLSTCRRRGFRPGALREQAGDPALRALVLDGRNLLMAALLDLAAGNLRTLLLGLLGTGTDLAFYTRGRQIPQVLAEDLAASLGFVLLPLFAGRGRGKESARLPQGELDRVAEAQKEAFLAALQRTGLAVFPAAGLLAASAGKLLPLLLGQAWQGLSGICALECLACALYPVHALHVAALRGCGRSGALVRLEGRKKLLSLLLLLSAILQGRHPALFGGASPALVLAGTDLLSSLLALPLNLHPLRRALGVRPWEECKALLPALSTAAIVGLPLCFFLRGGI